VKRGITAAFDARYVEVHYADAHIQLARLNHHLEEALGYCAPVPERARHSPTSADA
jgi:hypothetical protein